MTGNGTPSLTLAALLDGVEGARVSDAAALERPLLGEVRDDSRAVRPGDLFVAVPGAAADGRRFAGDAAARGAVALLTEAPAPAFPGLVVTVPSARRALARIAANRFRGAQALTLLAVTGTNGKTTTTYLVEAMLAAAGASPGVIGTVSNRAAALPGGARAATLTTPGALALQGLLAEMQAAGTTDVVLEATSIALEQARLDACAFQVVAMTNVTQDHLDYHVTMEAYFDAKAILFERLVDRARGVGVTFVDQDEGRRMRARCAGAKLGVARAPGAGASADVIVERSELSGTGLRATLATPVGRLEIRSPLVGEYNLANVALAVGMAVARGLPADAIVAGAAALAGVPGRLERVPNRRGVLCVVDYAHTPDALERAIAALRPLVGPRAGLDSAAAPGRLIVVFGCGGDRDRTKRPLMGQAAARDADIAIVTSDNPRTEEPRAIVDMVLEGVRRVPIPELPAEALARAARGYHAEPDRRTAIARAARAARAGDVLLIAGKGHEDYQILGTTKIHFDDREEAAAALEAEA
jgi:UDP-N-acetylmuramoyl-L-alanyl-D-glutamate--2,6-diaminopimelate ligase